MRNGRSKMTVKGSSGQSVEFSLSSLEKLKLKCCREIIGLTDRLYEQLLQEPRLDERLASLVPLLLGVKETGESVLTLLEAGFINQAFMLMRPLLEKATVFSFLTFCSDEEYGNYVAYGRQKALRMLDRQVQADELRFGLKYSGADEVKDKPEYSRLLEKFTGAKGGERTRWSNKSLTDMVGEISAYSSAGQLTAITHLAFYERASEALHGTLYGLLVHTGYWDPRPGNDPTWGTNDALHESFNVVVVGVAALLADLFLHAKSVLPASELVDQCEALRATISIKQSRA